MATDIFIKVVGTTSEVSNISPQPVELLVPKGETQDYEFHLNYLFDNDQQKTHNPPRWQLTLPDGGKSFWESGQVLSVEGKTSIVATLPGYTGKYNLEVRQQCQRQVVTNHTIVAKEDTEPWKLSDHVINDADKILHVGRSVPVLDVVILDCYYGRREVETSYVEGSLAAVGADPETVTAKEIRSPSPGVVRLSIGKALSLDKTYQFAVEVGTSQIWLNLSTKPPPDNRASTNANGNRTG